MSWIKGQGGDKEEQMGPGWKWGKELAKRREIEESVKYPRKNIFLCEKISNVISCEETGGK